MTALLVSLAVETKESSAGATPWIIGGGILLLFLFLMFAMLAFGKGRDHS